MGIVPVSVQLPAASFELHTARHRRKQVEVIPNVWTTLGVG